jgi:hypothetical protein
MTTADDHWPATLQRVVATLDFELANKDPATPEIRGKTRGDISQLPALVSLAVRAALELDKRVEGSDSQTPVDRKAILARKDLVRAMSAATRDIAQGMFVPGYATAYRMELARILWTGIADAPRRRLEELAGVSAPPGK